MQFTTIFSRLRQFRGSYASIGNYVIIHDPLDPSAAEIRKQWKQKYVPVLTQSDTISEEIWEDMRKYIISSTDSQIRADNIILHLLKIENFPAAGISYFKFLESKKYNLPISVVCRYVEFHTMNKGSLSTTEKEHIVGICNDIMNKYATYDRYTATILVSCLCWSDKWQEAVKVVETFETHDDSCAWQAYSILMAYLFEHDNEELGYKYLINTLSRGIGLSLVFYNAYFEYCLKEKYTFKKKMETLFDLWSKYGYKPSESNILACIKACNRAGWYARLASGSKGVCNICEHALLGKDVTDEEFNKLSKVAQEKLIFQNLYNVTHPDEIKRFKRFVEKRKPYGVIIDGLNMLHMCGHKRNTFKQILTRCKTVGEKVLVIGRKHMRKQLEAAQFQTLADYFFVEDLSNDDTFILYGVFLSGKNTKIISQDLMRNHEFSIEDNELRAIFRRWQVLHQYSCMNEDNDLKMLNSGTPIDAAIQKHNNHWHIPYIKNHSMLKMRHTSESNWTCINMCP